METTEKTFKEAAKAWLADAETPGTSTEPFIKETKRTRARFSVFDSYELGICVTALITLNWTTEQNLSALLLPTSADVLSLCDVLDGIEQL